MYRTIILPVVMGIVVSGVARQWIRHSGVRVSLRARDFLLKNAQTVSGVHPVGMGVKRQECEAYSSHSSSAEAKNEWSCASYPVSRCGMERV